MLTLPLLNISLTALIVLPCLKCDSKTTFTHKNAKLVTKTHFTTLVLCLA